MKNKIAVISDIHSNHTALKISLDIILQSNVNICIILGDLLTYGSYPNEVIKSLLEFKKKIKCIFIKGNHDQFYFDIANGSNFIKYKMPDFVKESILWNQNRLKYNLYETFNWYDFFIIDNIYFAHANAFIYPDWTYMNSCEDIKKCAKSLHTKKINVGIFGHTHRNKRHIISDNFNICTIYSENTFNFNNNKQLILNSGSIGQPRNSSLNFMMIEYNNEKLEYKDFAIKVDYGDMIMQIENTDLTPNAKENLKSYWNTND